MNRGATAGLALLLLGGLAGAYWSLSDREDGGLVRALTQRGNVVRLDPQGHPLAEPPGTQLTGATAAVGVALSKDDPAELLRVLAALNASALLLDPHRHGTASGLTGRLARYEHVGGMRGLFVSPTASLYGPDPDTALDPIHAGALSEVARRMMAGERPPRIQSFPEPLRRLRNVEVMVLLRRNGRPRLWRSARGSSMARALLTAVDVARQRWNERSQTLGGPLSVWLPRMALEVYLLQDDGTLGSRDPLFVKRAFGAEHGVAYERKGAWRYLLPEMTATHSDAVAAYRSLLEDNGLTWDAFGAPEFRPYRLTMQRLAVSKAEPSRVADGLDPVDSPQDVLGPGADLKLPLE